MRFSISARSISLVLLSALLLPPTCFADSGSSIVSQLDECEKVLVGKTNAGSPIGIRVEALERNLFGATGTGSLPARLAAIKGVISGTTQSIGGRSSDSLSVGAAYMPPTQENTRRSHDNLSAPQRAAYMPPLHLARSSEPPAVPNVHKATQNTDADRSPDHVKDLLKQAIISFTQGDLASADRQFQQVLSLDPSNVDANYNLGAMAEEHGDLNAALQYYRQASAAAPEDNDIKNAASSVERKLRKQQGQTASSSTSDANQLNDLAKKAAAAFKSGNYDGAISDLQLIADQEQGDASVQYGLAVAWRGKGDLNRAKQHLSRAISLAPGEQLYGAAMDDLDKQIQARLADGNSTLDPSRAAEVRNSTRSAQDDTRQTASADNDKQTGGIVPFTDQGAPQPQLGYAGAEVPVAATGYGGLGALPVGLAAESPFDQAIASTLLGLASLGATSRCNPTYYAPRYTRYRVARGALAGSLLGLFTRGW